MRHRTARAWLLACALAALACGPVGPIPGTWLRGRVADTAPADWSFSNEHLEVQLETRGRWLPHSVTTVCMTDGPHLYIPSRNAPEKDWVQNVVRDPDVRVRIGDVVYERRAVRVTDEAELLPGARDFLRKYYGLEADAVRLLLGPPPPGDDRAELWVFRLDPRSDSPLSRGGAAP